ncbi:MAG: NAD(P)-dependent alcohol dehydrogenase [Methanomassiliicoccus sp.]|nr:MAG: NAD(P)-dependent alcohol dehydrogenase [Methanomassiliicoccus sp.]
MKAVVWTRYGSSDVLQQQDLERPTPKDNEVLVKVHAASINSWDWELLTGRANFNLGGRLKPPYKILGCDVAGTVEDVGRNVTRFRPGDEVFGDISRDGWGGFAEFVCARETSLSLKMASLSFEQAAAIPQAATLALQSLRDKGKIRPGQRVLINGAGGGVGTFAVQIAKSFGAEVTGVDRAEKLDMLLSIGADHVVDHIKEDFTRNGQEYDLIVDVQSHRSVFDYKRALAPKGICVLVGGSGGAIFKSLLLGSWAIGNRKVTLLLYKPDPLDLALISDLIEAGKVVPVIDRRYVLSEVADAFRYYAEGNVKGKIVVTVQ